MSGYVYPELARHLKERSDEKAKGYGTPLKTNNGRHPLVDAYQELLDAILYMNQYTNDYENSRSLKVSGQFFVMNESLKVSDRYWLDDEPLPVDNGGEVVIDDVLYDLGDCSLFVLQTWNDIDVMYRDCILLAERVRIQIEREKIQTEGGLS